MKINIPFNVKVGEVVRYFILSDFVLIAGWGMVQPIFAVFVISNIEGATLATVGVGTAIYWLVRSFLQLPIARYLDAHRGEEDDFYVLVVSLIVAGIAALLFLAVRTTWHLYLVQGLQGLAFALYTPAWTGIFSRHLDRRQQSFNWTLDSTAVGISFAASGLLGGFIVEWFGFEAVFILAGVFSLGSTLFILSVPRLIYPTPTTREEVTRGPLHHV
jgi:MFS family permease